MSEIQKPGFSSPYENLLSISTEEKSLSIPAVEKPLSISAAEKPLSIPAVEKPLSIPAAEKPLSFGRQKNHYPFQLRQSSHPFPPQYTAVFPPFTPISRIPWKIRFATIGIYEENPKLHFEQKYIMILEFPATKRPALVLQNAGRCPERLFSADYYEIHHPFCTQHRYCTENHPAVEGTGN